MCKSTEILDSASLPDSGDSKRCWVHPVFQPLTRDGGNDVNTVVLDASGTTNLASGVVFLGNLSCSGWLASVNSFAGLFVDFPTGGFGIVPCNFDFPVACCAPPAP